jgi:GAF domain-containing protein
VSQIPKRVHQNTSNLHASSDRDITFSINDHVGDYATSRGNNRQMKAFPPQQVAHQRNPVHWAEKLRQRAKTLVATCGIVSLTAILTLPVLAHKTTAYSFINQSTQSTQIKQAPTVEIAQTPAKSRRKLALTLAVETIVAALLLVGLVAAFMANRAMRPIMTATKGEKLGKKESDSSVLSPQLSYAPTPINYAPTPPGLLETEEASSETSELLTEITLRIRQSQYSQDLLRTTVKEVRRAIKTERVIIYGLDPTDWDGTVLAESVDPSWPQTIKVKIDDPCFRERHVELYKQGQVTTINDIYQDPRVTDCYRRMLEQFAVRANLVAPILKNNELAGLMIAHHCSEPRIWQQSDVDLFTQVATQVGFAMEQVNFLEQQEAAAERGQLFTEISTRIRQCVYLDDLLKTTVKEVRRAIKTERVIIFGLDPMNYDGIVVAESVAPGLPQILKVRIDDPCLRTGYVEMYLNGRVRVINDIYKESGLTDCYIKMVEQFAVKAQLVAPIVKNNDLLGLLIAHQCSEPRVWDKHDIDLFAQLATQLGFASHQVSLLEQID